MSQKKNQRKFAPLWAGLALCAFGCFYSCNDGYDLMDNDPDWLGSSIYDYLNADGNYTNMVRLINDLGYKEVLARTGSKTLFVADDEAFDRFFQKGSFEGVHSYEQLSTSQKKMLLNGAMINNSLQVAYLSNSMATSGSAEPTEGDCMRRISSISPYDTVPLIKPSVMPQNNKYWGYYIKENKTIPCLSDATDRPMVHFIEAFLANRKITNEDMNFLNNYASEHKSGDASVNGVLMTEQNIRCSNGFIHKMAEVTPALPNMAELINSMPNTTEYAKLLERFSAPFYSRELTEEYNRLYKTSYDSVFQKRYFSKRSQNGVELSVDPFEKTVDYLLKFDPGWNTYFTNNLQSAANTALQQDMAVMLVPTDDAMKEYFNNGPGRLLKENFGDTWECVPNQQISELINVNMLLSLTSTVPSKFKTVQNDILEPMDIKPGDVDHVYMCDNGAVFVTNKVFSPGAFEAVSYPASVSADLKILDWAILDQTLNYKSYLISPNSKYSFLMPNNEALQYFIDPCSFGKTNTQIFLFQYHPELVGDNRVSAEIRNYNTETGEVGEKIKDANINEIRNRLKYIMETHIIVGDISDGHTYYKTKNGSTIKVENGGSRDMTIQGGYQMEQGTDVSLTADPYEERNGFAYRISEPVMTSRKSVCDILQEHEEFSAFYELLRASEFVSSSISIGNPENPSVYPCPSENINLFNTFNYTVYVPTNEAIIALQETGELPTWEQVEELKIQSEEATDPAEKAALLEESERLAEQINMFLKYHIQDNSFYIGENLPALEGNGSEIETFAYQIDESTNNLQYKKLRVKFNGDKSNFIITDNKNVEHSINKANGLYNLNACEYMYNKGTTVATASEIYTTSYAVVHQIDNALNWK